MKYILLFLVVVGLSACGGNAKKADESLKGDITIDGSSTVFLLTEAMTTSFAERYPNVNINLTVSGTSGGFKKFCHGETDINDASRKINGSERKLCDSLGVTFLELPVAYDGIAIVTNTANTWINYLTVKELGMIWMAGENGGVKYWNQIRPEWPEEEIHLFGAGKESGTFDFFTEEVLGLDIPCRTDYLMSEDDNLIVEGVANDKNALGYFGIAYFEENKDRLKLIPVSLNADSDGKDAILPTPESVSENTYKPLSRTLYIYVSLASLKKEQVHRFVDYYLEQAAEKSTQVGYMTLPAESYIASREMVSNSR